MTKLVTILARELVEWPEGFDDVVQASNGALHLPGIGQHVRQTKDVYTKADDWLSAIITREMWQAERERLEDEADAAVVRGRKGEPTVPVWLGDGLPPVGVTVLNRHGEERRVVAHDGDTIVCAAGEGHYRGYTKSEQLELRPIKSDRDRWIEAACKETEIRACTYNTNIDCSMAMRMTVEAIYDAGLAKMPEVE